MVVVLNYHGAETSELLRTFSQINTSAVEARSIDKLERASCIILPACASMATALADIRDSKFLPPLYRCLDLGVPILGIRDGMAMLFDVCYIDGAHTGLGFIPGKVDTGTETAILAMKPVRWTRSSPISNNADFYFDSNESCAPLDSRAVMAESNLKPVGVASDNVFGVQFRPEKSGSAGAQLLTSIAQIRAA